MIYDNYVLTMTSSFKACLSMIWSTFQPMKLCGRNSWTSTLRILISPAAYSWSHSWVWKLSNQMARSLFLLIGTSGTLLKNTHNFSDKPVCYKPTWVATQPRWLPDSSWPSSADVLSIHDCQASICCNMDSLLHLVLCSSTCMFLRICPSRWHVLPRLRGYLAGSPSFKLTYQKMSSHSNGLVWVLLTLTGPTVFQGTLEQAISFCTMALLSHGDQSCRRQFFSLLLRLSTLLILVLLLK